MQAPDGGLWPGRVANPLAAQSEPGITPPPAGCQPHQAPDWPQIQAHRHQQQQQDSIRQCFLFTNHLLLCVRAKDGKLHLLEVSLIRRNIRRAAT